jgi:hypothetical protein
MNKSFAFKPEVLIAILLVESILLLLLWLNNEYLAGLITVIAVVIPLGVLVVSLFAELFEKSRISKTYFALVGLLVVVPLIIAGIFYLTNMK